ncbi:MAG: carbamoyl-phosphate synthase large subunit [Desulfobacterales bacterium]|jgi:carbamoyl-phosphate synthase large subunit
MPRRDDINKVLIIGSGPTVIGQACEFDYSGTQACNALRSLGYKIVIANSNPATIMTDPEMADATYIEPLNTKVLSEIIAKERPDALLPNFGGQGGLNLSAELHRLGVLEKYGVKMIGVNADAIERGEDRFVFKETMDRLGIDMPRGQTVETVADAETVAEELGFPVVIRPAYTMGGAGGGLVYNMEELQRVAARGLAASLVNQVLVEESVLGWAELEIEVLRDAKNQIITVCCIENVDPMGIHTGDSLCTAPMLTIASELQERLQRYSYAIIAAIDVIGGMNLQFAHDPASGRVVVIEINPRTSRSSALASKATGFPMARISALLAGGLTLDEIPYWRDGTLERYTPSGDHVVVKYARWAFEKFEGVTDELGTQMQAVGEVMSLGRNYKEAFQKAIRSLEIGRYGLGFAQDFHDRPLEELLQMIRIPSSERQFQLYEALRKGADVATLGTITRINPWFIEQMQELVALEEEVMAARGQKLADELLTRAKQDGFADRYLADLLGVAEVDIRTQRLRLGLEEAWEPVPVSGVENGAYYYATYNGAGHAPVGNRKKIMVLGGGPNRIGQGIEFDYCCVHAAMAIRAAGYESIMVNCNPETVSTDYDISDRLYIEPLSVEDVLRIHAHENPAGIVVQFGGQTPLNMAGELARAGVRILGTPPDTIDLAKDRDRFRAITRDLGIPQPASGMANSLPEARRIALAIGYPLMVRPSYVLGGPGMEIIRDEEMLAHYVEAAMALSPERPILIDKFLDNAVEAEADAIADATDAFVPAVMEHIELAGIHSGDSACVIPPVSIAPKHIETIREYTRKMAVALKVVGLMNIQYAIYDNTVYVLEANPRASRTVPLVSKVCDVAMARLATEVMLGRPLADLALEARVIPHWGVKEAVFPFNMFPEVDPILGPEMRSTGEVLGISESFGRAYFKAQEATQTSLPFEGTVLFTIADRDKPAALEPVRLFRELGFRIMTTQGTYQFLKDNGIDTVSVRKLGFGRPNLVDVVKSGEVQLLVNTPGGKRSAEDNSQVRKAAIRYKVPYVTTTAAAIAAAKGIAARREGAPKVKTLQAYHAGIR